jgi:hypothetical protein
MRREYGSMTVDALLGAPVAAPLDCNGLSWLTVWQTRKH